jgi:hypothetical protein
LGAAQPSRAERRRLRRLNDEAGEGAGGVYQLRLITRQSVLAALFRGDPQAGKDMKLVSQWYRQTAMRDELPLCLTCDRLVSVAAPPDQFAIFSAFRDAPTCFVVAGICPACCARGDVHAAALGAVRRSNPGLRELDPAALGKAGRA